MLQRGKTSATRALFRRFGGRLPAAAIHPAVVVTMRYVLRLYSEGCQPRGIGGCESKLRLCCSTAWLKIVRPNNRGQEQHIMLLRSRAVLDRPVRQLSRTNCGLVDCPPLFQSLYFP
jgi:hypothetical protein